MVFELNANTQDLTKTRSLRQRHDGQHHSWQSFSAMITLKMWQTGWDEEIGWRGGQNLANTPAGGA
ncbi:MAG TPA: hypothetical protein PLL12_02640 [Aestuariivirga sp.]|jgi:hypothetical protein|nr:hypothetical protein [Hyphomicrobiales bacterium]HRA92837.1 hypothetical protein [Aestuariivirga sp.]